MRTLIMSCLVLSLCGCVVQQPQIPWESMTPEQQRIELERRRVAIDQQRANNEQIAAGLAIMKSAQPQFIPVQPSPFQATPFPVTPKPVVCNSYPDGGGGMMTICN